MKQNNVKIAVTGGIGSGKSLVCKIIEQKGYSVFSCDEVYSELLNGEELPGKIAAEFGSGVLNSDGSLNRRTLSAKVFSDERQLEKLNGITHPLIFSEIFSRASKLNGLVFVEVPVLFEGGYQNLFDGVIVVLRDEEKRILSVSSRDGLTKEQVKNRIDKQFNYNNQDFAEYYVIHNDGKIDDLSGKVEKLLLQLTNNFKI